MLRAYLSVSTTTAVLPTSYIATLYLDLGFLSGPSRACGFQIWLLSSPIVSLGSVNIWYSHHMVFIIIHPELNISKTRDAFFSLLSFLRKCNSVNRMGTF